MVTSVICIGNQTGCINVEEPMGRVQLIVNMATR